MAEDAFELRMAFKTMLENLSASERVINEATTYCLQVREHNAQDMFNCISEYLESAAVLDRINLLYVLDNLCVKSKKKGYSEYPGIVAASLYAVAKLICPEDEPAGDANAGRLKRIVKKWNDGHVLPTASEDQYTKTFQLISLREARGQRAAGGTSVCSNDPSPSRNASQNASATGDSAKRRRSALGDTTKDQILKRIEDDRERHKKLKEEAWQTHYQNPHVTFDRALFPDDAFDHAWEVCSDWDDTVDGETTLVEVERLKLRNAKKE